MSEFTSRKALSHWIPRSCLEIDLGRCQRNPGLPDLSRLWLSSNRYCQKALSRRRTGGGVSAVSLCLRLNDYRPLPFSLSLGHLPEDQRSYKDSYAVGSTRCYPCVYQPHAGYYPRCHYVGYRSIGKRIHRGAGPRIPGFPETVRHPHPTGFLRHSACTQG